MVEYEFQLHTYSDRQKKINYNFDRVVINECSTLK